MYLFLSFFCLNVAFSYQASLTATQGKIYWPNNNINIRILNNTSDIPANFVDEIIDESIAQWNSTNVVKIERNSNSKNEMKFESDFSYYGSAVVGLTELSFNNSGAITKARILLNDKYNFSNTKSSNSNGQIYLGDVLTHEFGHFLGLSHSEVLDSSMFYSTFKNQYDLSDDDRSGIHHKYGSGLGIIKGFVRGGNQIGVLGAHVQLIARDTGNIVGVVSDENGYFEARGLNLNKAYYIYVSPIKNPNSLPQFFANIQTRFCPGIYVGSFFSACGRENEGFPHEIVLTNENKVIDVGTITINCGLKVSEDYMENKIKNATNAFELISPLDNSFSGKAFVGYFPKTISDSTQVIEKFSIDLSKFQIPANSKLRINVTGYPFGSQLLFQINLKDNASSTILNQSQESTHAKIIRAFGTGTKNFIVEVMAKKIKTSNLTSYFPSHEVFSSDIHMPYLLTVELIDSNNLSFLDPPPFISDNESCLDAPFTYGLNNSTTSSLDYEEDNDALVQNGSSCGSIDKGDSGGNSGMNLLITCCGILFMQFLSSLAKKAKIFLS